MADHDQRLKNLVREFPGDLLRLAVPGWAGRFDPATLGWMEQEVFPDPPQGERRLLDLVARVRVREPLPGPNQGGEQHPECLLHVEVEGRDVGRARMRDYNRHLAHRYGLPVLSLALYLGVARQGVGWDAHEEWVWEECVQTFRWPYVGLPGLDAWAYVHGDNWLAVGLAGLMRCEAGREAELKAEAMQRIATAPHNVYRRSLLLECVEAYLPLEQPRADEYDRLLLTPGYQEARDMVQTTYEKGIEKGIEKGALNGLRAAARRILERRFGALGAAPVARLESWDEDRLLTLLDAVVEAKSLRDLGLDDPGAGG